MTLTKQIINDVITNYKSDLFNIEIEKNEDNTSFDLHYSNEDNTINISIFGLKNEYEDICVRLFMKLINEFNKELFKSERELNEMEYPKDINNIKLIKLKNNNFEHTCKNIKFHTIKDNHFCYFSCHKNDIPISIDLMLVRNYFNHKYHTKIIIEFINNVMNNYKEYFK